MHSRAVVGWAVVGHPTREEYQVVAAVDPYDLPIQHDGPADWVLIGRVSPDWAAADRECRALRRCAGCWSAADRDGGHMLPNGSIVGDR